MKRFLLHFQMTPRSMSHTLRIDLQRVAWEAAREMVRDGCTYVTLHDESKRVFEHKSAAYSRVPA